MSAGVEIVRVDHYNLKVDGHTIRATPEQEERIRAFTPEQIDDFLKILGHRE